MMIVMEVEYECSRCGFKEPKVAEEHMVLLLPVVDSTTQQPLHSLEAVFDNYFAKEEIEKHWYVCDFDKSWNS